MKIKKHIAFAVVAILAAGCSKHGEPRADVRGLAIGSLHSGTTMRQVVAEFGQPELDMTNSGVISMARYQKLGLGFLAPYGVVRSVSVLAPCTQRTREGIGIGSSRAAVIKAYGEPTSAKATATNCEVLAYQRLGFVCELQDGKVDSMTIVFRTVK
jgi:hypothetical protein